MRLFDFWVYYVRFIKIKRMDKLIISNNHSTYRRVSFTFINGSEKVELTKSFKILPTMQDADFDEKTLDEYADKIAEELKDENILPRKISLVNFQIEICAEIKGNLNAIIAENNISEPVTIDQVIYSFKKVNVKHSSQH